MFEYKVMVLDLTRYRTYASCGEAVLDQYLLPKIMQHLLRHSINVTVCLFLYSPSYIKTNLSINAVTGSGSSYGRLDETTAKGFAPAAVAERLVDMILKDEPEVVMADAHIRLAVVLRALAPALFFWFMKKRVEKNRKEKNSE